MGHQLVDDIFELVWARGYGFPQAWFTTSGFSCQRGREPDERFSCVVAQGVRIGGYLSGDRIERRKERLGVRVPEKLEEPVGVPTLGVFLAVRVCGWTGVVPVVVRLVQRHLNAGLEVLVGVRR